MDIIGAGVETAAPGETEGEPDQESLQQAHTIAAQALAILRRCHEKRISD